VSDCTVLVLFSGFYVEATLNHIVECMGETQRMEAFFAPSNPGLHNKMAWLYNEHVGRRRASTSRQLYSAGIDAKLRRRFPGFGPLHNFRNDISHGRINPSARSLARAQKLRRQAKKMADALYAISSKAGFRVPRLKTYDDAIRYYHLL
jgi:hypothetical protein